MPASEKDFLRNARWFSKPPPPQLAVFGKHPAWADHMDGFGTVTPSLIFLYQVLYLEGIGKNVGREPWKSLKNLEELLPYNHDFLWRRGKRCILGSLIESVDKKNRAEFPLVCALECELPETELFLSECFRFIHETLHLIRRETDPQSVTGLCEERNRSVVHLFASKDVSNASLGSGEHRELNLIEEAKGWKRFAIKQMSSAELFSGLIERLNIEKQSPYYLLFRSQEGNHMDVFSSSPEGIDWSKLRCS